MSSHSLRPELRRALAKAIREADLGEAAELITAQAVECLALVAVEGDLAGLGTSRFGGEPDLPPGLPWPTDPESPQPRYCNFLGQINFAELPSLTAGPALPRQGLLSLFLRSMDSAAAPVVVDALYFPQVPADLARRTTPPQDDLCDEYLVDLRPVRVQAVPSLSLPEYRKDFQAALEAAAGEDAMLALREVTDALAPPGQLGQMLGFANASDSRENLYRLVALGRLGQRELQFSDYWDTMEEYEEAVKTMPKFGYEEKRSGVVWLMKHREAVQTEAEAWQLLLRLNSNDWMQLLINDSDPLYVFARKFDLAAANFRDLAGEVTQG